MRAVQMARHGSLDVLDYRSDVPQPQPGRTEALVRVEATTTNRIDLFVRRGYPGISIPMPHVPGADIAGVIESLGSQVDGFQRGDRVIAWPLVACHQCPRCLGGRPGLCDNWQYFGMHRWGSFAEYVAVPQESLIRLPESVSSESGATLPVAGLTAYHALCSVGRLNPGETALIWGGSGGLGTFAVQIGRALGAEVIATVGDDAKRARVEALGASLVLNHHRDDVPAAVREQTDGRGIELVLDPVGAQTFPRSFELLAKGGRLLLCGKMTGLDTELSLHQTYLRHLSILGLYLGEKQELERLLKWVEAGKVTPVIDSRRPLSDVQTAYQRMEAGEHLGKLVLQP